MYLVSRENTTSVVRTVIPFVYAWLAQRVPAVVDFLSEIGMSEEMFVLVFGGLLYQLIRALSERWGWIGNLLIINSNPQYKAKPIVEDTTNLPV